MSGGKNQRALLMEVLVAVLFFILCAAVLLQTFIAAREGSRRAGLQSAALTELQVLSERLYVAEDPEILLESVGFEYLVAQWTLDGEIYDAAWVREGDCLITALQRDEDTPAGVLRTITLTASEKGEELARLDCTRYIPGEVAP